MFWSENPTAASSTISVLLDNQDVTLTELLDQDDILHECKSQNKKLVEFLERPNIIKELIDLIINEPPDETDPENSYRHPALASEIIGLGLTGIMEKIAVDMELLKKLSSFLESEPPLNTLLASFFAKTFNVLLSRHCGQDWYSYQLICIRVLDFFKNNDVFHGLLNHIGTSAIMDTLQCIIRVEIMEQGILKWLDSQFCIENLIRLTCGTYKSPNNKDDPKATDEESSTKDEVVIEKDDDLEYRLLMGKSTNAAQLLCNIILNGRDTTADRSTSVDPDPLLEKCKDSSVVTLLLTSIVSSPPKTKQLAIINGIQVLLVLLNNVPGFIKPPSIDPNELNRIAELILPFLPALTDVLYDTPTSFKYGYSNLIEKPVGAARLAVIQLLEVLMSLDNPGVALAMVQNDIITVLFNMFMEYKCNNFLHGHVVNIITNTNFIQKEIYANYLFVECKLMDKIVKAWEENDESQKLLKPRFGYMGHLVAIANYLNKHLEQNPELKDKIPAETINKWTAMVSDKLDKVNAEQKLYLGGSHPLQQNNSSHHQQHSYQMSYVTYPPSEEFYNDYDDDNDSFNNDRNIAEELFLSMCDSLNAANHSPNQKNNDMFLSNNLASSLADSESPTDEFEEGSPIKSIDHKILGLASKLSECKVQDNVSNNVSFPWTDAKEAATSSMMQELNFDLKSILLSPWGITDNFGNEQSGWADFSKFENTTDNQSNLDSFGCDPYNFDGLALTQNLMNNYSFVNDQAGSSDEQAIASESQMEKSTVADDVIASETFDNSAVSVLSLKPSDGVVNSESVPESPVDSSELQEHVIVISKEDQNKVNVSSDTNPEGDSLSKLEKNTVNNPQELETNSSIENESDLSTSSVPEISVVLKELEKCVENVTEDQTR